LFIHYLYSILIKQALESLSSKMQQLKILSAEAAEKRTKFSVASTAVRLFEAIYFLIDKRFCLFKVSYVRDGFIVLSLNCENANAINAFKG